MEKIEGYVDTLRKVVVGDDVKDTGKDEVGRYGCDRSEMSGRCSRDRNGSLSHCKHYDLA